MALAILRPSRVPGPPGTAAFDVELGSNRFFQFAIGDESVDRDQGFPVLGAPAFTSPLVGPLADDALGRTRLEIPLTRFGREHRHVQLTSFRTRERAGPALSDIVPVALAGGDEPDFPRLAFSTRYDMSPSSIPTARAGWAATTPMRYRDVAPMSNAMFLGSILPALQGIASKVLPSLGSLFGGGAGGGGIGSIIGNLFGGGGGGAPPVVQNLIKPETIDLIGKLLQQLQAAPATAAPPGKAAGQSLVTAASYARARAFASTYSGGAEYSHAAIAPALLAALPALAPLLEKVLNPETIKALLDHASPTKVIGAVTDSVKEIGKLGLDFDKQSNEHLRALNPMGVHGAVDDLLKGMGFASAMTAGVKRERGEPAYRRIESVELLFVGTAPVMIHGHSRVCYRAGEQIAFALDLKTPRTVSDASLTVLVKDPETRRIVVRKSFPVPQAGNGRLPVRVSLTADEIKSLVAGEEYLVCAYLVWKTSAGKRIGTSRSQLITMVGEYVFDRVEDGSVIPLNDVAKFRPFWHKVWQGGFTKELFKVVFEGKYFYILEPAREQNAPIETRTKLPQNGEKVQEGRLQSGMTTGLAPLNALIPLISTGKPLTDAQLTALRSSDFVGRFNTVARFNATLSGRAATSAALWMYPEVKLQEVVLFKAASTDVDGHVRELTEERVRFPIPVVMHVIGARTKR